MGPEDMDNVCSTSAGIVSADGLLEVEHECKRFLESAEYMPMNCSRFVRPAILRGCALDMDDYMQLHDGGSPPAPGSELYLVGNSIASLLGYLCASKLSPKTPIPLKLFQFGSAYRKSGRCGVSESPACQLLNCSLTDEQCSLDFAQLKQTIEHFLSHLLRSNVRRITVNAHRLANAEMTRVDFLSEESGRLLGSASFYGNYISRRLRILATVPKTEILNETKQQDNYFDTYLHVNGGFINLETIAQELLKQ